MATAMYALELDVFTISHPPLMICTTDFRMRLVYTDYSGLAKLPGVLNMTDKKLEEFILCTNLPCFD